jgi:Xaa-Pro dipeptidase
MIERDVETKISRILTREKCDALLAAGYDNFTYLTGVVLPFAPNVPDRKAIVILTRRGKGCILCPADWEQAVLDQGWKGKILRCGEDSGLDGRTLIKRLSTVVRQYHLQKGRIGMDSASLPARFVENLKQSLPSADWFSSDALFRKIRLMKSKAEIKLIETASRHSEIGIIGALQHMEGSMDGTGYTLSEFSERVRVHVYEAGGSGVGFMATMRGVEGQTWYSLQRGKFRDGDLIRIELTNHFHGYWSNACRMAVIGQPSENQIRSYGNNLRLKKAAEELCRPGVSCRNVFERVAQVAKYEKIKYCPQFGLGHGVGTGERESPYFALDDPTLLEPGMVVMLSIYSYGAQDELICSKDMYEITSKGFRLLSWYKNWDKLYRVTGFRSAH